MPRRPPGRECVARFPGGARVASLLLARAGRALGPNPLRCEAACALAQARTTRTAALLLDQHHGALGQALASVLAALESGDVQAAIQGLQAIGRHRRLGLHLTQPWRVVVAGAPNVGKSSLVNALAGYQRSVVSPAPGTTRDLVTTVIALDGWPIELIDTAGLRQGLDSIEREGIEQARRSIVGADLCLWILDASQPAVWPAAEQAGMQIVVNKIDLPPAWDWRQVPDGLFVSAKVGTGLEALGQAIAHGLVAEVPLPGAALPFTSQHAVVIDAACRACDAGKIEEARQLLLTLVAPRF